ncbi:hypothetical protein BWI96_17555 [Siphonobacter sp. SORGH_AS_0500]|uniref:hypothetical protein n=1 Tax=Siphonobacter sp. SORGH_AS_0500 TaxID=1864824 RepID=UPI000CC5FF36|nr:hypothetical protein [Siphonobacter sp. SORGH_AS_0500]PKK35335.1 hypothetical protein BWI96_17555 [Siphonobacter sp. SORGH_AS_0500]
MEPISVIVSAAFGYILKGAAQSKAADTAKEELVTGFWNWIKPYLLEDVPELEKQPEEAETEVKTEEKLLKLIQDESFFEVLAEKVNAMKNSGIREKNIAKGNISRVKKIRIGDKVYNPDEFYNRKNIVEGDVSDADEFILGDGH